MRFTSVALSTVLAFTVPFVASGFTPATTFTRAVVKSTTSNNANVVSVTHRHGCSCPSCAGACNCLACQSTKAHPASCRCFGCGMTALQMSTEAVDTTDDVPPEVEAMDGIASDEEAHNVDRPARGSGITKKSKKAAPKGTPIGELEVGSMVTGKVKAIMAYGAFVDIGASTDALLHVSRLSDDFVSNVGDIVKEGEEVEVRIVSIDEEKGQVAISMRSEEADNKEAERRSGGGRKQQRARPSRSDDRKALQALSESGYDVNKFVEGEVVSTLAFGAFVKVDVSQLGEDLEGTIEGLVHISSLTVGRVESVDSVVKTGDKVQVRVKMIDAEGGKASLSMIAEADEQQTQRPQKGERGQRPKKQRWSSDEMGADDWKESMDKFNEEQPTFKNMPIIVDKRKGAPVA